MRVCRSQPRLAIESYTRAMEAQTQYANLYHISWWEIACATLALWDIPASLEYWRKLRAEATWSKACYTVCNWFDFVGISPSHILCASSMALQCACCRLVAKLM